jgi:hypothetical protein
MTASINTRTETSDNEFFKMTSLKSVPIKRTMHSAALAKALLCASRPAGMYNYELTHGSQRVNHCDKI